MIALDRGWTDLLSIVSKMAGHVGPHCEMCSPGCNHCYSLTNNGRCLPSNGTGLPFDKRSRELVDIFVDEKMLTQPLHWKKPQRIFVENQSDLFGEWVPFEMVDRVFAMMALCQQHTFQVLTKRANRMLEYFMSLGGDYERMVDIAVDLAASPCAAGVIEDADWPLPNVWLGVSAEDQKRADERIPLLLQTPAAVRFVSYEPALGPITFLDYFYKNLQPTGRFRGPNDHRQMQFKHDGLSELLNWVIVGGESGPGARPFNIQWARDVIAQCKSAGVACFVKQLGTVPAMDAAIWKASPREIFPMLNARNHGRVPPELVPLKLHDSKGGDMEEWPEGLRFREFPNINSVVIGER